LHIPLIVAEQKRKPPHYKKVRERERERVRKREQEKERQREKEREVGRNIGTVLQRTGLKQLAQGQLDGFS
jgi:hypothetical protein